ncbi:YqhA family protein [Camelimonas sp. ID_303_24]
MLKRILSSSRYIMLIPVVGTFLGSVALLVYEMLVLMTSLVTTIGNASVSPKDVKVFAVGLVESVDVFLIGIAVYITSVGLYLLFIDDDIPMPKWLEIRSLEDLKSNLISVVIAVLAVLFLREAVSWDGTSNIVGLGVALGLVIAALAFFLMKNKSSKQD